MTGKYIMPKGEFDNYNNHKESTEAFSVHILDYLSDIPKDGQWHQTSTIKKAGADTFVKWDEKRSYFDYMSIDKNGTITHEEIK